MKSLIATIAVVLLAGCGHMGMQERSSGTSMQSSGGMQTSSSSGASDSANLTQREDIFQSWLD